MTRVLDTIFISHTPMSVLITFYTIYFSVCKQIDMKSVYATIPFDLAVILC